MEVALVPLALDQIGAVSDIELEQRAEDFAGGSMQAVYERLAARLDPATQHAFLIVAQRRNVGFFMLREQDAAPSWLPSNAISLHNFRISTSMQGRGYGSKALVLAAYWITLHRPNAETVMLSVNLHNAVARAFYLRRGFVDTGLTALGRLGPEAVLTCSVAALATTYGSRP